MFGGAPALQAMGLGGLAHFGVAPGAILVGKKALSGGRGASALVGAGRAISKSEKLGKPLIAAGTTEAATKQPIGR